MLVLGWNFSKTFASLKKVSTVDARKRWILKKNLSQNKKIEKLPDCKEMLSIDLEWPKGQKAVLA